MRWTISLKMTVSRTVRSYEYFLGDQRRVFVTRTSLIGLVEVSGFSKAAFRHPHQFLILQAFLRRKRVSDMRWWP